VSCTCPAWCPRTSDRTAICPDTAAWQLVKDKGATCPDGTKTPATYSYSWDQATLAGTVTTLTSDDCGMKPGATKHSFTLAYKEPLPIPVILDPLNQIENLW
jgi:hypothetical protein